MTQKQIVCTSCKLKITNMKGSVILVTYKEQTGGYGEYPGYIIRGTVYGSEPPEEEVR